MFHRLWTRKNQQMTYKDIDKRKTAFIFELDDVLFPAKDYLYQVYYLFANMLEFTDLIDAKQATDLMINTYITKGSANVFDRLKEKLGINEKYRSNLTQLLITAKLPLKLLLYKNMLNLLQEIVIDRKKLFIVTKGDPAQQLNKIKHTEWNGLEKYLVVYFANEINQKPETDVLDMLIKDHNLQRRELLMIGNSDADTLCAEAVGIDYISAIEFL